MKSKWESNPTMRIYVGEAIKELETRVRIAPRIVKIGQAT
jgi:hypothetical protein